MHSANIALFQNVRKSKQTNKKKNKHQTVVEHNIKRKNPFVCFLLISEAAIKCHYLAVPTEKIPEVV